MDKEQFIEIIDNDIECQEERMAWIKKEINDNQHRASFLDGKRVELEIHIRSLKGLKRTLNGESNG